MTADSSTIYLVDVKSDSAVEAELRDEIGSAQLEDWHKLWLPVLLAILQQLSARGVPREKWPQSSHWNWDEKVARVEGLLAFRGFCVVCGGETQGLMRVDLNQMAREGRQRGKPLVYVDYLEVAPWNRADVGDSKARYKGVGSALVSAAVQLSREEGFRGRIGLHSLPQADRFYRDKCRMTDLGPDARYQGLRYFEMTAEQADAFLPEEDER